MRVHTRTPRSDKPRVVILGIFVFSLLILEWIVLLDSYTERRQQQKERARKDGAGKKTVPSAPPVRTGSEDLVSLVRALELHGRGTNVAVPTAKADEPETAGELQTRGTLAPPE